MRTPSIYASPLNDEFNKPIMKKANKDIGVKNIRQNCHRILRGSSSKTTAPSKHSRIEKNPLPPIYEEQE